MFNKKLKLQVEQIISSFSTLIKSDNVIIGELGYCKIKVSELLGRTSKVESKIDKATNRIDKLEKLSNEYEDVLTRREGDNIGSELDYKFDVEDYVECNICGCLVKNGMTTVSWELDDSEQSFMDIWRNGIKKEAVKIHTCKHCSKDNLKNKKKK